MKNEERFLGDGLLVYPVTEADVNQVSIYFPGQNSVSEDPKNRLSNDRLS